MAKLRTTPDVLQQYHKTFLDQRDRVTIEEVLDQQHASGNIIHYLSHQAIFTPMKEFTKLRVVFDASAHFEDKPSLNDVLHQGPRNTQYVDLAKELHENVYVDNVILTASHVEETLEKYRKSKAIFNEMNMNLRGYLSNYKELSGAISPQDRSGQLKSKVLGIEWYSAEDTLAITTRFGTEGVVTKRTMSKQIASMYDPMGWLTPLLIKGKLFLQSLWKSGYDWDTKLSSEHEQEWNAIVKETNG
ncbi:unnamed protein product [Nippostrongylus brasiliensis]|uniref:NADAR domain-containing protein n=1 Tax=Nippostrongylus brasiliensis TaxID=27835 RepID=A0A0N4YDH0_NIPBR|nr:unnamed protein product [Nippostrongylus brasiliensis]